MSSPAPMSKIMDVAGATYIGLDLGTFALKVVGMVVASSGELRQTHSANIVYEEDLHSFVPAVRTCKATGSATSSPRMFLAALDLAFLRLSEEGFDMGSVAGISGSAQMHGSVYVTADFDRILARADPSRPVQDSLEAGWLAIDEAPIWMDSSTAAQCDMIEHELGGHAEVAARTGSRAYMRFTGPQIRKRADTGQLTTVSRAFLISSFLASLCCGKSVAEDVGDASGTNFFDIESVPPRWWSPAVSACCAEGLLCEAPVEGWASLGNVSEYLQKRYEFPPAAVCCAWSGDNPNTVASYGGLDDGALVISLGTSDTAQWKSQSGRGTVFGHTFRSPLASSEVPEYFRMLCYSNGSQLREAVRDGKFKCVGSKGAGFSREITWDDFDSALRETEPAGGESLRVGVFHQQPEILPVSSSCATPIVYDVAAGEESPPPSWSEMCRLCVEARALAIRTHGETMDCSGFEPRWILLAGGGSASKEIPQIFADVLRVPVFAFAGSASAATGAAQRARHCVRILDAGRYLPFSENAGTDVPGGLQCLAQPRKQYFEIYAAAAERFKKVCIPEGRTPVK